MMNDNHKIPPLKKPYMTIGELPSSYTESMTYYETLVYYIEYLNKIRDGLNYVIGITENYEEYLKEIQEKVIELEEDYLKFKEDIEVEIDTKFAILSTELHNEIMSNIADLKSYIDNKYNELNARIDDIIAGDINLYDPTTGILSPIQTVINNIYDAGRNNAITCTEFDELELTATEFDAFEITAYEFDINGKSILTAE